MPTQKLFLIAACLNGLLAVAFGAFGAHLLKGKLDAYHLGVFQTGVQYQFYHVLALYLASQMANPWGKWAGLCFLFGILVFSGSLYTLALSGVRAWGAVTPFGGVAFLIGWGILAWGASR